MIAVYAKCLVKPDKTALFQKIVSELTALSRRDAGCLSYHCGAVKGQENSFAFVELWQSEADLERHLSQPHFQSAVTQFESILAGELVIEQVECA